MECLDARDAPFLLSLVGVLLRSLACAARLDALPTSLLRSPRDIPPVRAACRLSGCNYARTNQNSRGVVCDMHGASGLRVEGAGSGYVYHIYMHT